MSLNLPGEIYDRYSCGCCMHLAAALNRQLGWKIQAVVTNDSPPNYVEHAWVVDPTGKYMLDVDGYNPITTNGWPCPSNTLHEDITEAQLKGLTLAGCSNRNLFDDATWNATVARALDDILKSNVVQILIRKNEASILSKSRGRPAESSTLSPSL